MIIKIANYILDLNKKTVLSTKPELKTKSKPKYDLSNPFVNAFLYMKSYE